MYITPLRFHRLAAMQLALAVCFNSYVYINEARGAYKILRRLK